VAYYVVRVAPRKEDDFLKMASRRLEAPEVSFVYPRRTMEQRKGGRRITAEVALFPGYVFLQAESLSDGLYDRIKALPGFYSFLRQGDEIGEMRGRDLDLLSHFLKFGEVTPKSTVTFDENQRIRVLSGPMEGMEGQIIHVDRRKRRAKIQLDFDHGTFTVTLGFELMDEAAAQEAQR